MHESPQRVVSFRMLVQYAHAAPLQHVPSLWRVRADALSSMLRGVLPRPVDENVLGVLTELEYVHVLQRQQPSALSVQAWIRERLPGLRVVPQRFFQRRPREPIVHPMHKLIWIGGCRVTFKLHLRGWILAVRQCLQSMSNWEIQEPNHEHWQDHVRDRRI